MRQGGNGKKIRKLCGRHLWTVPKVDLIGQLTSCYPIIMGPVNRLANCSMETPGAHGVGGGTVAFTWQFATVPCPGFSKQTPERLPKQLASYIEEMLKETGSLSSRSVPPSCLQWGFLMRKRSLIRHFDDCTFSVN